eukprot:1692451-Rhodomonas_salina.1
MSPRKQRPCAFCGASSPERNKPPPRCPARLETRRSGLDPHAGYCAAADVRAQNQGMELEPKQAKSTFSPVTTQTLNQQHTLGLGAWSQPKSGECLPK